MKVWLARMIHHQSRSIGLDTSQIDRSQLWSAGIHHRFLFSAFDGPVWADLEEDRVLNAVKPNPEKKAAINCRSPKGWKPSH